MLQLQSALGVFTLLAFAWLISEKSYDVGQVRQAAKDWLAAANPGGFSGDACSNGGCGRPIRENGCGGMDQGKVL